MGGLVVQVMDCSEDVCVFRDEVCVCSVEGLVVIMWHFERWRVDFMLVGV